MTTKALGTVTGTVEWTTALESDVYWDRGSYMESYRKNSKLGTRFFHHHLTPFDDEKDLAETYSID